MCKARETSPGEIILTEACQGTKASVANPTESSLCCYSVAQSVVGESGSPEVLMRAPRALREPPSVGHLRHRISLYLMYPLFSALGGWSTQQVPFPNITNQILGSTLPGTCMISYRRCCDALCRGSCSTKFFFCSLSFLLDLEIIKVYEGILKKGGNWEVPCLVFCPCSWPFSFQGFPTFWPGFFLFVSAP